MQKIVKRFLKRLGFVLFAPRSDKELRKSINEQLAKGAPETKIDKWRKAGIL